MICLHGVSVHADSVGVLSTSLALRYITTMLVLDHEPAQPSREVDSFSRSAEFTISPM